MKTPALGNIVFQKHAVTLARALIVAGFFICAGNGLAQLDPGGSYGPTNVALDSWTFYDHTNWTSDLGYAPASFSNLSFSQLGNFESLVVDTNVPAWLQYNVYENDGTTNLTVDSGTVIFWFAPGSWSSTNAGGTGPGEWGRLFETGTYTTNSNYGWWSIYVDPAAANLYFSAQTNDLSGVITNYLAYPISWTTNFFHFIALTYSPTNTALYLDGVLATNGPGVTIYPGPEVLTNGFFIGSDFTGANQAHGLFDFVATYNYPLDSNDVATIYESEHPYYQMNPWNLAMESIDSAPSSPSLLPDSYDIITGQGSLEPVGSVAAITSTNVWITNVTASVTGGTMALTFTIQGGSDGLPYDVFANSVLDFSATTNYPWGWMGQGYHGNIYTLTNLPMGTCFLILGTPQDSDGDGLTDAYERLVSKTNPYLADTSGDGISDSDEILNGYNPLTYNPQWQWDSDSDGLPDAYESQVGLNPNSAEAAPGLPTYSPDPVQ